jgi:protoporphyrinogen oxidase
LERVVVAGAGPAGLSAAHELATNGRAVTVFEQDPVFVGGISRTVEYRGYRFDIGGHRFFSKSSEVEAFWRRVLGDDLITRRRSSRIYYGGKFYDYPLSLPNTLKNLGPVQSAACLLDYLRAKARPTPNPVNLEDWVINQFGERLYRMFFKTYTEKVWGMDCREISADWAAQRIRGLSMGTAIREAAKKALGRRRTSGIKTLIEEFRYPRLGPGMLWERVRDQIVSVGGEVVMGTKVVGLLTRGGRVREVVVRDASGRESSVEAASVISSMPLRSLVRALGDAAGPKLRAAGESLHYRDFLTVVLIWDAPWRSPDQWLYVHDPGVQVGRIQNFKNWSPEMVPNADTTCLGLEYFCFEGDGLWSMSDPELLALGERELKRIGLMTGARVVDGTVVRVPKAYPVYDDGYRDRVRMLVDELKRVADNVQVVGRNGMHRYNNQDHAMMTGFLAARNLMGGRHDLWAVNDDAEYLEVLRDERSVPMAVAHAPSRSISR